MRSPDGYIGRAAVMFINSLIFRTLRPQRTVSQSGVRILTPRSANQNYLKGLIAMLVFLAPLAASAQGRIDPSLPPAPLVYTRTLFLFPGVETVKDPDAVVAPLTVKQKYSLFWHRTVDFSLPVEAAMFAGGSQAIQYSPRYGRGPGPFAQRFGSYAGSIASSGFFTDALLPSLFRQDPRYFRKGRGSTRSRLLYALQAEVITHTNSGNPAFNASGLLGFGMSTALTDAWYPNKSVTFGNTMQRYAIKLAISAVLNVVREFGGSRKLAGPTRFALQDGAIPYAEAGSW